MKILSGIDLPYGMTCGSMILAKDIYSDGDHLVNDSRFLCLESPGRDELPENWLACQLSKDLSFNRPQEYQDKLDAWVEAQIEDYKPEVIHCQHLCYGMSNAFVTLARDLPVVALCHGTDVIEASRSHRHRTDFQRIVARADRLVFPSEGILSDAREITSIDPGKVSVIPWGIPDHLLLDRPSIPRYSRSPFNILYAGRFDESKGIDTLLHALARTPAFISLTLIGAGPELPDLMKLANDIGISNRIHLKPWLSRDDLQFAFRDYQLLVLPSLRIEAFGLVCLEAQAAGLPVLASDASGLPETLPSDSDFFSFKAGDSIDLATRLVEFSDNCENWTALSRQCRDNSKGYAISTCVRKLLAASKNRD